VVQEAVAGGIPGIAADPNTDFSGYVVSRYPATDDLPINRIVVRPKTPFGKEERQEAALFMYRLVYGS
jgi:hypothetical protein